MMRCLAFMTLLAVPAVATELKATVVTHFDLPQGVDGQPGVLMSKNTEWLYVSGNGAIEAYKVVGAEVEWEKGVTGGSGCSNVRGLKGYEGQLFLLCGDHVQVFSLPDVAGGVPLYTAKLPLFEGVGVAMDVDSTRGHLWVLASDDNYELQQYDLTQSKPWTARLLDAINLHLPRPHELTDLAVNIDGDDLIITTSALTQKRSLSNTAMQPVEVVKPHQHVAIGRTHTAFSVQPANGNTVLEVVPHTDIASGVTTYTVPFVVSDLAAVEGVVVAVGPVGTMYLVDPVTGDVQNSVLHPRINTVKLSVLPQVGWVAAASRSAVTLVSTRRHAVTVSGVPAEDISASLRGVPRDLATAGAFGMESVPAGRDIVIACDKKGGCDVYVTVYHCPPCSSKLNGGIPSILSSRGWQAGSCVPKFLFNGQEQPMVGFRTMLAMGETATFDTTLPLAFFTVLIGEKTGEEWCRQQPNGMGPFPRNPCLSHCAVP